MLLFKWAFKAFLWSVWLKPLVMSKFLISFQPSSWMRWWRKQRISFVSVGNHSQSHLKWRHLEIQRRASSVSGDWTAMQPCSWEQSSVWKNIEAASSLCHFISRWWIQCSPFRFTYTASLTILKASCWHQLLTRIECPLYNLLLSATSKIFRLVLFHLWRDWHDWSWYSLFSNNGWLVCHI